MHSKSTIKNNISVFLSHPARSPLSMEEEEYIKLLSKEELNTLQIAREHLESSFNLKKSIGFIKWKENKN